MPNGEQAPWEKYRTQAPNGPWEKYARPSQPGVSPQHGASGSWEAPGVISKAWDWLNKPLAPAAAPLQPRGEEEQRGTEMAMMAAGGAPTPEQSTNLYNWFARPMTSPLSIGLTTASMGTGQINALRYPVERLLASTAESVMGGAFATQGAKEMMTPQQPGEEVDEAFARRMLGGLQVAGGAAGATGKFHESVNAAEMAYRKGHAINQGIVKGMNAIGDTLSKFRGVVERDTAQLVDSTLKADEADIAKKQGKEGPGFLNTLPAVQAAGDATVQLARKLSPRAQKLVDTAAGGTMTLRELKSLSTQVGDMASKLSASSDAASRLQAPSMWAFYDALNEAGLKRAGDLGRAHGSAWKQYKDIWSKYQQSRRLGVQSSIEEAVQGGEHEKALDTMLDTKNSTSLNELAEELGKRGIDPANLERTREIGTELRSLSAKASNMFFGKIRAIMNHPFIAGPVAAGAAVAGHAAGIPGMGFVLPLILAGRVAGVLDHARTMTLLREWNEISKGASARVSPEIPTVEEPPPGTKGDKPRGPERRTGEGGASVGGERRTGAERRALVAEQSPNLMVNPRGALAAEVNRAIEGQPGRPSTPEEIEAMDEAQSAREEHQFLARRLQRARKKGSGVGTGGVGHGFTRQF